MTWNELLADWKQLQGKIQAEWGRLTSDDLAAVEGHRERLVGKIQERYELEKAEAERKLDDWLSQL